MCAQEVLAWSVRAWLALEHFTGAPPSPGHHVAAIGSAVTTAHIPPASVRCVTGPQPARKNEVGIATNVAGPALEDRRGGDGPDGGQPDPDHSEIPAHPPRRRRPCPQGIPASTRAHQFLMHGQISASNTPQVQRAPASPPIAAVMDRAPAPARRASPSLARVRPYMHHDRVGVLLELHRATVVFSTPSSRAHTLAVRTPCSAPWNLTVDKPGT